VTCIDRGAEFYDRLCQIQRRLEVNLNSDPKDYSSLHKWNRIVIMKETMKLLMGTCDITIEQLTSGVLERGNWK